MTKLSDDIKRALSSLAYQDAGEFLSTHKKMELLGESTDRHPSAKPRERSVTRPAVSHRRIALLTDDSPSNSAVTYAIETANRLDAKIELLTHGATGAETYRKLEQQITDAGALSRRIHLKKGRQDEILRYFAVNSALIFLIASVNDTIAKALAEEIIPNQLTSVPVPLVLINDNQSPSDQGIM
jgi:hypothetical protein